MEVEALETGMLGASSHTARLSNLFLIETSVVIGQMLPKDSKRFYN